MYTVNKYGKSEQKHNFPDEKNNYTTTCKRFIVITNYIRNQILISLGSHTPQGLSPIAQNATINNRCSVADFTTTISRIWKQSSRRSVLVVGRLSHRKPSLWYGMNCDAIFISQYSFRTTY